MKKKLLFSFLTGFLLVLQAVRLANAVSSPLEKINNKVGVHILDPNEVDKVSDLVNSNGGDWGYVTVPLRADDRDRIKWQKFFKVCQEKHIIPIIRLATTMKPYGWEKPTLYDSVDFANFLNDLDWPAKNRYIVVYNEPNHASEWGGVVDPIDYGRILQGTIEIFKNRSENFFILPAGLDAAAPNNKNHQSLYTFISQLNYNYPQALQNIDGWTSHSYPNPGFSGSPTENHSQSINSFVHETTFIKNLTGKDLPVFITETGWQNKALSDQTVAAFYTDAFENAWSDDKVVAVTPFVLFAGDGPFKPFSLLNGSSEEKPQYKAIKNLPKIAGQPEKTVQTIASNNVLGVSKEKINNIKPGSDEKVFIWGKENWKRLFEWLMSL